MGEVPRTPHRARIVTFIKVGATVAKSHLHSSAFPESYESNRLFTTVGGTPSNRVNCGSRETTIMRTMLVICACCLMLFFAQAVAADKIRIEIVETSYSVPDTTMTPVPIEHTTNVPFHQDFFAKAVLPDGSHASLKCSTGDKDCAAIEPMESDKSSTCAIDAHTVCRRNLGVYKTKREGRYLTIYAPNGKRKYQIVGSW